MNENAIPTLIHALLPLHVRDQLMAARHIDGSVEAFTAYTKLIRTIALLFPEAVRV